MRITARMAWCAPACALFLLGAAAPARPTAVPSYRSFGHWFVACDNTRSCQARGFGEGSATDLTVLRDAGTAGPSIVLSRADRTIDPTSIHFDDLPFPLSAAAWAVTQASPGNAAGLSTSDPLAIGAFIEAARGADALQLGPPGDDTDQVPLDGFTAALLMMDAVQGRPGTAAPLIAAPGDAAPPPAPPLPQPPAWSPPSLLGPRETDALLAQARSLPSPDDGPCDRTDQPELQPLDARHAIVIRTCALYAYQSDSLVYVLRRDRRVAPIPVILRLPGVPVGAGEKVGPDMTEPGFDPATGQLSIMAKGRGIGDCGVFASWVWHAGAFRLISLSYQDQCGGSQPGDFPTLYRTVGSP